VIAVIRQRLAAGEQVARMYQEPGLAWLQRQAEVAEDWSPNGRQPAAVTDPGGLLRRRYLLKKGLGGWVDVV
jgi:hypothetical protein